MLRESFHREQLRAAARIPGRGSTAAALQSSLWPDGEIREAPSPGTAESSNPTAALETPMNLRDYVRDIPDFPKPGILFRDITPLLRDAGALASAIDQLAERCAGRALDAVAGIESRGFVFATALAVKLGLGLIPIRKPGKLPHSTYQQEYELEYGVDSVEVHRDAMRPGEKILLVDDLLATGGTMGAACNLVRQAGAEVAGCLFVIELSLLNGRERLPTKEIDSLIVY
jgi:adenine phosphoribosyltransferase